MNLIKLVQPRLIELGNIISKESPTILTSLGVVGMITTVVMAVRATPKAQMLLMEKRRAMDLEYNEKLPVKEVIKTAWKPYVPTVIMAAATTSCIIGANSVNLRRNAAIASAYALAETSLREYQQKVVDMLGEGKAGKIRDGLADDRIANNPFDGKSVILTGKGDTLFYDSLSGRYFKSDMEKVRKAQNDFNVELINHTTYSPLNDFYELLGVEDTDMGASMGWDIEHGILDIHFSAKIVPDLGIPCIVLEYKTIPRKL